MKTPEKSNIREPEELKEQEKAEEPRVRVEARPVEDIRSGKKKEYAMMQYEDEVFSFPTRMKPRYDQFDAGRELQKILLMRGRRIPEGGSMPEEWSGEVKARLAEMKEMLMRQGEGIGIAIRALERMMRANPDAGDAALFRNVLELAPKYRFSNTQLEGFWKAIILYRNKHSAVEKYRKEFPDDGRLFAACFGRAPQGKVEVIKEPMMLYVRCYDDGDYVFALTFRETGGDEKRITSALREWAMQTGGGANVKTTIGALDGAVAVERASAVAVAEGSIEVDEKRSAAIRAHEGQHLINRLFEPLAWRVAETEIMARIARTAKTPEEAKRTLMVELARSARAVMGMDNEARDEILAFYKDGSSREYVLRNLTQSPLYAYRDAERYQKRIKELPSVIAATVTKNMSAVIDEKESEAIPLLTFASEVEPFVNKAFGEDYEKDIVRWVGAIETLEHKGYARDEIVSMLYGERVPDWQAFARRAPEKGKP